MNGQLQEKFSGGGRSATVNGQLQERRLRDVLAMVMVGGVYLQTLHMILEGREPPSLPLDNTTLTPSKVTGPYQVTRSL